MRTLLAVVSALTALMCGWLSVMYVVLGHDGWPWRAGLAALLVAYSALAILLAEDFLTSVWAWRVVVAGGCAAMLYGYLAVSSALTAMHFEGFWLPIGFGLILQGILAVQNGLKGSFGLTWPWSS